MVAECAENVAFRLGCPFPMDDGKLVQDDNCEVWAKKFTEKSDGSGKAVFVGFAHFGRRWVVEEEN